MRLASTQLLRCVTCADDVSSHANHVSRSLGQNFVTKDDILAAIVRAARVVPGRTVLEIGPGTGNLTRHLLSTGARVVAVEKDDALFARLQERFQEVLRPAEMLAWRISIFRC